MDVAGRSALARVISTLADCQRVTGGALCGPSEDIFRNNEAFENILRDTEFEWLPPAEGPSASALSAIQKINRYPVLLTAGDHALLTPALVDDFCTRADHLDADVVVGLVPYDLVHQAFPDSKRTVLKFSDGQYCGSNLFAVLNPRGEAAPAFWSRLEADRKRPWRMARRVGPAMLFRYLFGQLTLEKGLQSLSSAMGCRVAMLRIDDPRAAVDVDSVADRELAESIINADQPAS